MSHRATVVDRRDQFEQAAWVRLSTRLGAFVDSLTPRRDVIAEVGVGATPPSNGRPAGVFDHLTAKLTIDAAQVLAADDDPDRIDLRDPRDCARYPVLAGVAAHEIGHATHTVRRGTQPRQHEVWAALLEEARMEGRVVTDNPRTRNWLQASATHILGDPNPRDPTTAARLLILVGGRADAGVYDADRFSDLPAIARQFLDAADVEALTAETRKAVQLADGDVGGLMACAAAIADVMAPYAATERADHGIDTREDEILDNADNATEHNGDDGHGNSARTTVATGMENEAALGSLAEDLARMAAEATNQIRAAAGVATISSVALAHRTREQKHRNQVLAAGKSAARTRHVTIPREATADELRASRYLNESLNRASARGVERSKIQQSVPPGRLQVHQLARRFAQIESKITPTATPWIAVRRRMIDSPILTVGIAIDISDSMEDAAEPAAVSAWLLERAARPRGGQCAAALWNGSAALLPAGDGKNIHIPETCGTSDALPAALMALDAQLHLTTSDGARMVAIVTDGALPNVEDVNRQIRRLTDTGVTVLWITVPGELAAKVIAPPPNTTHLHLSDPQRIGQLVATAAVTALAET